MNEASIRYEVAQSAHAPLLAALFSSANSGCFCTYWHFEGDKNAWLERCFIHPADNRAAFEARLAGAELSGIVALEGALRAHSALGREPPAPIDRTGEEPPVLPLAPSMRGQAPAPIDRTGEEPPVLPLAPSMRGQAPAPIDRTGEERAVGWMKLERAERLPSLYAQRIYRGLPCFQSDRTGVFTVGCFFVAEEHRGQGIARGLLLRGIEAARERRGAAIEALPRASAPDAEPLRADELPRGPAGLFRELGFTPVSDFEPYPVLRLGLR